MRCHAETGRLGTRLALQRTGVQQVRQKRFATLRCGDERAALWLARCAECGLGLCHAPLGQAPMEAPLPWQVLPTEACQTIGHSSSKHIGPGESLADTTGGETQPLGIVGAEPRRSFRHVGTM